MEVLIVAGAIFLGWLALRNKGAGQSGMLADYEGLPPDAQIVVDGTVMNQADSAYLKKLATPVDWGANYDWGATPAGIETPLASGRYQGE